MHKAAAAYRSWEESACAGMPLVADKKADRALIKGYRVSCVRGATIPAKPRVQGDLAVTYRTWESTQSGVVVATAPTIGVRGRNLRVAGGTQV